MLEMEPVPGTWMLVEQVGRGGAEQQFAQAGKGKTTFLVIKQGIALGNRIWGWGSSCTLHWLQDSFNRKGALLESIRFLWFNP